MMKKTTTFCFVFILIMFTALTASAQEFSGYQSSNFTGVNGVFTNPANIVDSPYNWDVNLFGFSVLLGNDQVALSRDDLFNFDADRIKPFFLRQYSCKRHRKYIG